MKLLAATGMLGYGFTETAFARAIKQGVDLIGCDAGSMDPGPITWGPVCHSCPDARPSETWA